MARYLAEVPPTAPVESVADVLQASQQHGHAVPMCSH
jgi:hypothetical protein